MFPVGGVSGSSSTRTYPMSLEPDARNSRLAHMLKRHLIMYLVMDVVSPTLFTILSSFSATAAYGLVTVSPLVRVMVSPMMTPIVYCKVSFLK
jgi:hypothetical protein